MKTSNEYLLLFRGTDWHKGLSPEQVQQVMNEWRQWFERLTAEGTLKSGQPLERSGRVVSGRQGRVVSDGPFAESKEAIGGYFLLQAASLDEATAIAKQCPGLAYGGMVEVRQIAPECPLSCEASEAARNEMAVHA